jgi:hypothetical protein
MRVSDTTAAMEVEDPRGVVIVTYTWPGYWESARSSDRFVPPRTHE